MPAGAGNPLNSIPDLEQQLFLLKKEFPLSIGHQLAPSPCPSYTEPLTPNEALGLAPP